MKFLLVSLLLLNIANYAQAQSDSTEASAADTSAESPVADSGAEATTTESSAVETPAESTPEPEVASAPAEEPGLASATCSDLYVNYARSLPKAKQAEEYEAWWAMSDNTYNWTKNDEFKFKEEAPKKKAEFLKLVAAPPAEFSIQATVILGKYDFKKKGFPVEIAIDKRTKFLENKSSGSMSFSGIGGGAQAYLICGTMMAGPVNKKTLPSNGHFKFTNLEKFKFFPVPEAKAPGITSSLGGSRTTSMNFHYKGGKTTLQKQSYGGPTIVTETAVLSADIGWQETKVSMKP